MKQKLLLKTMLLLCALVAGSSSVWADNQTKVVNFESELATYTDWEFTDLTRTEGETIGSGNSAVTTNPHGGDYFVKTSLSSGSWAVTKEKIATPVSLVCYYTKCTTNTNSSSLFKIQVSSDKSNWTDVASGKTMNNVTAASWEQLSADLSNYSDVYVRVYYKGTTAIRGLDDITLTYTPGAVVNVAGVSLNKSTTTIMEGLQETLTATVSPDNATDKSVTWTSSEENVATVDNGVVTALSPGTSTITVKTNDGNFTASCVVTITALPVISVTFDFTTNDFSFPAGSDKKTTSSANYTYGGYTLKLAGGGDGNGYYWHNNGYLLMGKTDCALTFPSFNFNVSEIKIYGTSGASTGVKQNIFVGNNAVSTETTGAKNVTNVYKINANSQSAGTIYILKVTSNANTQISKIEVLGYQTITPAKAMTTFCSSNPLKFTGSELKAYVVSSVGTTAVLKEVTDVPSGTGLILVGDAGTSYNIPVGTATTLSETNKLVGVTVDTNISQNAPTAYDYVLSDGKFVRSANGTLPAGKAYLPASAVAGAPSLDIVFDGDNGSDNTTDINSIENGQMTIDNSEIYNLNGQRVAQPTKGLYIVNGRKVIVK